jgi:hypothetical protein
VAAGAHSLVEPGLPGLQFVQFHTHPNRVQVKMAPASKTGYVDQDPTLLAVVAAPDTVRLQFSRIGRHCQKGAGCDAFRLVTRSLPGLVTLAGFVLQWLCLGAMLTRAVARVFAAPLAVLL